MPLLTWKVLSDDIKTMKVHLPVPAEVRDAEAAAVEADAADAEVATKP